MKKNLLLVLFGLLIPLCGFADKQGYAVFNSETSTLTFKYGDKPTGDNVYDTDETSFSAPWDCSKIKKVVFDSSFAEARPKSTARWFYGAELLTEIVDMKYLNTSNVTGMFEMFSGCSGLTSLDLSNFDTSNVTNMFEMFYDCSGLTCLDLSNFDTSNVTSMRKMFSGCNGLTSLDISNFDTSNVTDLDFMFYYCSGLTSLDVSNFDTSNVTDMSNMFEGCRGLTSLDVSNFNTSNVTDMNFVFYGCSGLTSLGVSNFNTSNVTSMYAMFYDCSGLTSLDLSNFDTSNVTDMFEMFSGCSGLTSLDVSNFHTSNVTDMGGMFSGCSGLTSLDVSNFDTSNVTAMGGMFSVCSGLTSLDVSNFNTSNVTYMWSMFSDCSGLTSLDVSNIDTSNVTAMSSMFSGCSGLTSLDVSNFDTSNVTNMSEMFSGCSGLTSLDVSNFHTSNVADMWRMFKGCSGLTSLEVSNFDTSNVTNMSEMFSGCSGLTSLDVSNFHTSNVISMWSMFSDCSGLTILDLGSFGTSNVTNIGCMFYGCESITTIYVGDEWSTTSFIVGSEMFTDCEKLVGGKGTKYDAEHVDYTYARIDGGADAPGYFSTKGDVAETYEITIGKNGKTTFCGDKGLDFSYSDEVKAFIATGFDKESSTIWMTRVKDVPAGVPVMIKGTANETYKVPVSEGGSSYYENMFVGNTTGETLEIGETSEDGKYVNYYMSGGQFKSVKTSANIASGKCYLQLPADFEAEATGEALQVKIAASGKSSFAAPYDLDFTSLNDDLKAFTATGYDKSSKTIWLTRVKKVQKGEGLLLKGTGGATYTIPSTGVQAAYENMIVGNTSGEKIKVYEKSDDNKWTNYYLSGGSYVSVVGNVSIGNNKSYLQLPTYMLAGVRSEDAVNASDVQTSYDIVELETESMPIIFASIGGDGETTGVVSMDNGQWIMDKDSDEWYSISGQRISKPTKKGLYIHNGKKVVIRSTTK